MRLALVTDIHGNLAALEAVAADIRRHGVDQTLNLGDSLSGPLLPLETAQFLMEKDWISLAGNHDRHIVTLDPEFMQCSDKYAYSTLTPTEFSWLRSLPPTVQLTPDVLLCHGTPTSDVQYFLETVENGIIRAANHREVDERVGSERSLLLACGHTHIPRVVRSSYGQVIVNPGSVGLQAYDSAHPSPHLVETGSPNARYAIVEKLNGEWAVSLHSVPYNHKSMAQLAKLRGRTQWEYALLTGYNLGRGAP